MIKYDFSKFRVLILGDFLKDIYINGTSERLSPEAPVPVIKKKSRKCVLGGAANVAMNVSSLGGHFDLFSIVNSNIVEDKDLQNIFEQEKAKGNNFHFIFEDDKPTIEKHRVMIGQHQICRIDKEERFEKDICSLDFQDLSNYNAVIFSDYNKGTIKDPSNIIHNCNQQLIPVIADFKDFTPFKYLRTNIIKLNESETLKLANESNLEKAMVKILLDLKIDSLIVTRSNKSVLIAEFGSNDFVEFNEFAVPDIQVLDVSGAGDTFLAAYILSYLYDNILKENIEFAIAASTAKVKKLGTSTVTLEEVKENL